MTAAAGMARDRWLARIRGRLGASKWCRLVARVGAAPGVRYGAGLSGAAYALPGGRALKFGTVQDLAAAELLRSAGRHPNVARIHDAFLARDARGAPVAVLVRDAVDFPLFEGPRWLDPLCGRLFGDLEDGMLSYERTDRERRRRGWSEAAMGGVVLSRWLAFARRAGFSDRRLSEIRDGIVAGVRHILSAGVPDDTVLNTENIGLRHGRAVIFDITAPGRTPRTQVAVLE